MTDPELTGANIERAIYLVGGVAIFLWGFQSLALSFLSLYETVVPGPAPDVSSHFWVTESVGIFVGIIILLAGFFLLFLAFRAHRSARSPVSRDTPRL